MVSISWNAMHSINYFGFCIWYPIKAKLNTCYSSLLALGIWTSAVALKSKLLYFSAIFINVSAFVCFYINRLYQPLLLGIVAVVSILIPGLI